MSSPARRATRSEVQDLADEAANAGDHEMVTLCYLALRGDVEAQAEIDGFIASVRAEVEAEEAEMNTYIGRRVQPLRRS